MAPFTLAMAQMLVEGGERETTVVAVVVIVVVNRRSGILPDR